ncbi:hypothetical protein [Lysobacter sp. TY2-98]|uniref:2'-5' RNA ligase family protein n=1 Tax=Lysobacter sp. TY2-98 TaxID=2290922 RepID=UPI0013B43372|nr:hypothetical protein [Lysobacter sp. TY2-98]
MLIARPPRAVVDRLYQSLVDAGIIAMLGGEMFPTANWHQSLSDAWSEVQQIHDAMMRAGDELVAAPVTMQLAQIDGPRQNGRRLDWVIRPSASVGGFADLVGAVRSSLQKHGINERAGHTPHITASYRGPHLLPKKPIAPVEWTIDTVELVATRETPYRYETLARWPLTGAPEPRPQMSLSF